MSNILKIVDLTDHAVRRAVFAAFDGLAAEQRAKPKGSDRISTRGLAWVVSWQFGLPMWDCQRLAKAWRRSQRANARSLPAAARGLSGDNANRLLALAARAPCAQHSHVCGRLS